MKPQARSPLRLVHPLSLHERKRQFIHQGRVSSNCLFCPSAHAKFAPEFLKISKFGGELVTDEELEDDNNAVVDPFVEF